MENELQIRKLVENWAQAVRARDLDAIVAYHHENIVMYDVPPPFASVGIDAYRKSWDLFYSCKQEKDGFQIIDLHVIAGEDVAFCYAQMKCIYFEQGGQKIDLDFRLTIGFQKIDGQWWFMHEHHSVPAT
jgi:uncharacterized protein (TIGR02246 family)